VLLGCVDITARLMTTCGTIVNSRQWISLVRFIFFTFSSLCYLSLLLLLPYGELGPKDEYNICSVTCAVKTDG